MTQSLMSRGSTPSRHHSVGTVLPVLSTSNLECAFTQPASLNMSVLLNQFISLYLEIMLCYNILCSMCLHHLIMKILIDYFRILIFIFKMCDTFQSLLLLDAQVWTVHAHFVSLTGLIIWVNDSWSDAGRLF